MKDQKFERLLTDIREEKIDDSAVEQAASRVWSRLTTTNQAAAVTEGPIQGCPGFQALLPAYFAKTLPPARMLLVEDHLQHCVRCRGAGAVSHKPAPPPASDHWSARPWAIAAALFLVAGLTAATVMILGPERGPRAVVQSIHGALYRVSTQGAARLSPGEPVVQGEQLHTAKATDAVLRLTDGSLVEVSDRADLSVSNGWSGTTISLNHGNIIVQAARQRTRRLYVSTGDCLVSVKGTIFAVSRGTKGSRVSVLQGDVKVEHDRVTQLLHPGEQATSTPALAKIPVQQQISWSRDSGKYLALLGELKALGNQIEAIPSPGLRYQSKLAAYVPADAVIYAAIPNVGSTLAEASRMFDERASQSEVLREWWTQQRGVQLRQVMEKVQGVSSYLGDEIVLAVSPDASGHLRGAPVILAETSNPGLPGYLATQFKGSPQVYLKDNIVAVSPEKSSLAKAEASITQPGAFTQTPFYQQIAQFYQNGAGWLFCADMEQIVKKSVPPKAMAAALETGLADVRYLVVERKEKDGRSQNQAALSFSDQRSGVIAWLAAPAPMGSLDFVSPNAAFAASFVIKNPASVLQELISGIESKNPKFAQELAAFEAATGVDVINDLAGPLGGDFTISVDGPLVPVPSWKLSVEVYDPSRLESTIERLIDAWNMQAKNKLTLTKGTYNTISGGNLPAEIDYTFSDGYLIAAPTAALLQAAIQNRSAGITLTRSSTFQALLPADGYTNFSGLVYQNVGPALAPLAGQLSSLGVSVDTFTQNSTPSLVYAYGEPNRIVVASNGSFFGLGLDALVGGGGSALLLPQILRNIIPQKRSKIRSQVPQSTP
ncbi:MAG TPA: FecR domain-containing protein [Bryobacteraceae bacterium]|nr:FecR domain-containing protein [Bryobacteraceae bacterium]